MDGVWAAVGPDSLTEILGMMAAVLDGVVPGLDGRIAADALIGAFPNHFECEHPCDAELLERLADFHGDAIVNLVRPGAVKPADALQVGLRLLSALAALCRSDSVSLLQPTA